MIIKKKFNIGFIFFCLFFVVFAGCGKKYYKSQNESEKQKQAEEAEKKSKELELKVKQEALTRKINELLEEIKTVDNELTFLILASKEKVSAKSTIESKIKIIEIESRGYKDKLDEIMGQINIFTAKERVSRIRSNNKEADNYKKKADTAKVEAKDFQEKYDVSQKQLENLTKELNTLALGVKKAQDNEKAISEKLDSLKAQLAEVEKITPEQLVTLSRINKVKVNKDSEKLRLYELEIKRNVESIEITGINKKDGIKEYIDAENILIELKHKIETFYETDKVINNYTHSQDLELDFTGTVKIENISYQFIYKSGFIELINNINNKKIFLVPDKPPEKDDHGIIKVRK